MIYFTLTEDGLLLHCHVQARASRRAIAGIHADRVKIQLAAPPVDGKANEQLCRLVGEIAGIPRSKVRLVRGETSRQKTLLLEGLAELPDAFPPPD